ncbi:MAG: stalk domain-containing protein [Clostridia bacterium]|nr:stalk domain-containing protein [Clostridia bacterium]
MKRFFSMLLLACFLVSWILNVNIHAEKTGITGDIAWNEEARQYENVKKVIFLNGKYYAILKNRYTYSSEKPPVRTVFSSNGEVWKDLGQNFHSMSYGNNQYVGLGEKGLKHSGDGINWSNAVLPDSIMNFGSIIEGKVIYAGGKFYALFKWSESGYKTHWTLLNSGDGARWNTLWDDGRFSTMVKDFKSFQTADFFETNGKLYIQCLWNDSQYPEEVSLLQSDGNDSWNIISQNLKFNTILYNGRYYAAEGWISEPDNKTKNGIFYSGDGIKWSFVSEGNSLKLMDNEFYFILSPDICIVNKSSFAVYKKIQNPTPNVSFEFLEYDKNTVLLKNIYGIHYYNGSGWAHPSLSINEKLLDKAEKVNGKLFLTGLNTLFVSGNGLDWEKVMSDRSFSSAIAKGGGRYVVVGDHGFYMVSNDLIHWNYPIPFTDRNLYDICWDGKSFIAVGEKGSIFVSQDGANWSKCSSSTDGDLYRIKTGKGVWAAAGKEIVASRDGVNWKKVAALDFPSAALEYGPGYFIVLSKGYTYISQDGFSWVKYKSNYLNSTYSPNRDENKENYDILWAENHFTFFYGFQSHWPSSSDSVYYTSEDGLIWKEHKMDKLDGEVFSLAYGLGRYVAAGTGIEADGFIASTRTENVWNRKIPIRRWFKDIMFDEEEKKFIAISNNHWDDEYGVLWVSDPLTEGASPDPKPTGSSPSIETPTPAGTPTPTEVPTVAPTITPTPTNRMEVTRKIYGICFSPYFGDLDPTLGNSIENRDIENMLRVLQGKTEWIRTYGMSCNLDAIPKVAKEMGFKTAVGAYISGNEFLDMLEINKLVQHAKEGYVDIAIIGNETMRQQGFNKELLKKYLKYARDHMPKGVLVSTSDTFDNLMNHKDVVDGCDVVMANLYSFWGGASAEAGTEAIKDMYKKLSDAFGSKQVIISEVGFPTEGKPVGKAVPSLENSVRFFHAFISWAEQNHVPYYWFEFKDEKWKSKYDFSGKEVEHHFGIYYDAYDSWSSYMDEKPGYFFEYLENMEIVLKINDPKIVVNKESKELDPGRGTVPVIKNDRTLIPIRAVAEALGFSVEWVGKEQKTVIRNKEREVVLWIGKKGAQVSGKPVDVEVEPRIMNARTYLPLRFIAEGLGCKVDWDKLKKRVIITYQKRSLKS